MTLTIHIKPDQIEVLPEAMKVGGVTKRASRTVYIIPSNYTGENLGLLTYLTKVKNYGKDRLNQSKKGIR